MVARRRGLWLYRRRCRVRAVGVALSLLLAVLLASPLAIPLTVGVPARFVVLGPGREADTCYPASDPGGERELEEGLNGAVTGP